MRKLDIRISNKVRHKPACTVAEEGSRPEVLDLESRRIVLSMKPKKALISIAVTAKLICTFVFTKAKIRFSHGAAQMMLIVPY